MKNILGLLRKNWVWIFLVALPICIVFRPLFQNVSLSLGDAPYFSAVTPEWFLSEPVAWTQRGISFGGINQFVWIWPFMLVVSVIQHIFSLNNWIVIRLFFYLPSLLLAPIGAYFLSLSITKSRIAGFVAAIFSVMNTYFILLFDGGQVGVVLAYGIFPWAVMSINRYLNSKITIKSFICTLLVLCVLTIADPRVAVIAILTSVVLNLQSVKKIFFLLIGWFIVNLYWIYPLITLKLPSDMVQAESLQMTSFLNGFFIYSPHWYENLYGKVTYPSVLFYVFPLLLLVNYFISYKHKKKLLLCFLFFVFLIKGTTDPFGNIYSHLLRLPLGSAFRDSTKFFIPAIYIGGILLGMATLHLSKKFHSMFIVALIYISLLIPLYPAMTGKMNFVLSGNESNESVPYINDQISQSNTTDRTIWFPEQDPRSFESSQHELVNGKELTNLRIFSSMNVGTEDLFNFLNDPHTDWWFDLLNIRRLAFIKDPRVKEPTELQQKDSVRRNELLANLPFLKKDNSGLSLYENENYLPRIFGVKTLFVVTGSDSIYSKLEKRSSAFKPNTNGFVFVEDGKWDPSSLSEYATTSAVLINDSQDETDLPMSMLQKSFMSVSQAKNSNFAIFSANEYLKYKYELLIRKVVFDDFDFNRGIAFSSEKNELLNFEISTPEENDYSIAVRHTSQEPNSTISISIDGSNQNTFSGKSRLSWSRFSTRLTKGKHTITIQNNGGLQIVNVISVVPVKQFSQMVEKAKDLMVNFPSYTVDSLPISLTLTNWEEVPFTFSSRNRFILNPSPSTKWIIWTNNFDPRWKISRDTLVYESMPFYSSVNGFYRRPEWNEMTLEFTGQESVRWGIYYSIAGLLVLVIIFLCV